MTTPAVSASRKRERTSRDTSQLALAMTLAVSLCLFPFRPGMAGERAQNAGMAVSVVRAANHCFTDRVAASGVLVARQEVDVRADRDGLLVGEVLVEAGDVVARDQVLARLVSPKAAESVAIKAPVGGVLVAANAVVGAYTSAGTGEPLFRVAADGAIELKARTLAANLSRLRDGMAAKVHVVGLGAIDGRVVSVGDGLDAQTQLASLRIAVGPDPRLRIGGFARADIDAGRDCGLQVPLSAVLFTSEGAVVATVDADRVVMRRVTTGLIEGGDIEIKDGLSTNDLIIARAAPFLRDGDHVRPAPTRP